MGNEGKFVIEEVDYLNMRDTPYGWRWLDTKRVDIPKDELNGIRPLTPEKAKAAYSYSERFQGTAYQQYFEELDTFVVDSRGDQERRETVSRWLEMRLPADQSDLLISWTEKMAVVTDRDLFIKYWDSFCYPVEDVVIWPLSEGWVLLFDYKQRFFYAIKRK